MSDTAVKSFVGRIRDILHDLSPSERRLAEFALDFPGDLAGYTASELASLAHVSASSGDWVIAIMKRPANKSDLKKKRVLLCCWQPPKRKPNDH
jgi:hypothetical protein